VVAATLEIDRILRSTSEVELSAGTAASNKLPSILFDLGAAPQAAPKPVKWAELPADPPVTD